MNLVFATHNENKVKEIRALLPDAFKILNLKDINCLEDIPETAHTIKENAMLKARYVFEKYGYNCFADDTGLEVEALNGAPGVYSARYAGEEKSADANMDKLLNELKNHENRNARFVTFIALIVDAKEYLFQGVVEGLILKEKIGVKGFGYDPVFSPNSASGISFAQMDLVEKNKISHRAIAINKLIQFLQTYNPATASSI